MLSLLQPISQKVVVTPSLLEAQMVNDYFGTGTLAYNRNTSDSKITYVPTDNTQIFGRYSIEPFSVTDPQALGQAGGGTRLDRRVRIDGKQSELQRHASPPVVRSARE